MAAATAPTGTVTLVFTDVEASTALWERVPAATREAIALHDALLRELLETRGGYEMRTEGDAFKVAFESPVAAVRWCHEVQARLLEVEWPQELLAQPEAAQIGEGDAVLHRGLRVRMGGHLGTPEASVHPTTGRTDYYGSMVNETARIAAAPSGGQIVFSDAAWSVASREDPGLAPCGVDLGDHWLKDVARPTRLWQALPPSLGDRRFPPLRTRSAERTNVTRPPGRFFGRNDDLATVAKAFDEGARLVTVMGPGGTGKTRLSLEYASTRLGEWVAAGGVWLCELESARNALELAVGVAKALGVRLSGKHLEDSNAATQAVASTLSGLSRVLIILDNLEQIDPQDLAVITQWLEAVPDARFLATSRHRLQLPGERVVDLRPLSSGDAAALFVERAKDVRPDFAASTEDGERITEIVKQVDCLPLAVELAASRADVMSVGAIAKRLGQRFRLLARKSEGSERQGALRSAIDWSWELLDQAERSTLAQCSVFRGGFTVDAADEIIDLDAIEDAPWPIDVIQSLRQKSLLRSRESIDDVRLDMYASIQEYAAEKLTQMGLDNETRERHARYYLEHGERWAAEQFGPNDAQNLGRVRGEVDNLLAAYTRFASTAPDAAARVALAMRRVVDGGGSPPGYRQMLDSVVKHGEDSGDDLLVARGLEVRGHQRQLIMDAGAHDDFQRGLALARKAGDRRLEAQMLRHLASESMFGRGTPEQFAEYGDAALAIYRELGLDLHIVDMLAYRSFYEASVRHMDGARAFAEEATRLAAGKAGPFQRAMLENARAGIALHDRDFATADAAYTATIELHRRAGETSLNGFAHAYQAAVAAHLGDLERARELLERASSEFLRTAVPGLRALPRATAAWLDVIQAVHAHARNETDEVSRLLARAREGFAHVFAPGPSDAEHPQGRPPLVVSSAAIGFLVGIVRDDLELAGLDPTVIEP